eukprot:SAG31_NODE_6839_length_1873_cov_6.338219_1_plen_99_part_00
MLRVAKPAASGTGTRYIKSNRSGGGTENKTVYIQYGEVKWSVPVGTGQNKHMNQKEIGMVPIRSTWKYLEVTHSYQKGSEKVVSVLQLVVRQQSLDSE